MSNTVDEFLILVVGVLSVVMDSSVLFSLPSVVSCAAVPTTQWGDSVGCSKVTQLEIKMWDSNLELLNGSPEFFFSIKLLFLSEW